MKQIHIWPNHVAVHEIGLVLPRAPGESVGSTLRRLAQLGLPSTQSSVEFHGGVQPE
jgi:hypothetical protein